MQVVQQQQHGVNREALDTGPEKLVPPKESVRPLWYSTRVMQVNNHRYLLLTTLISKQADELLRLSKNIGAGWKNVGNGLKFNWAQVRSYRLVASPHTNCFSWNNLKQILGVREKQSIECCSGERVWMLLHDNEEQASMYFLSGGCNGRIRKQQ